MVLWTWSISSQRQHSGLCFPFEEKVFEIPTPSPQHVSYIYISYKFFSQYSPNITISYTGCAFGIWTGCATTISATDVLTDSVRGAWDHLRLNDGLCTTPLVRGIPAGDQVLPFFCNITKRNWFCSVWRVENCMHP